MHRDTSRHHDQSSRRHTGRLADRVHDDREPDDAEERGRPGIAPGAEHPASLRCGAPHEEQRSTAAPKTESRRSPWQNQELLERP